MKAKTTRRSRARRPAAVCWVVTCVAFRSRCGPQYTRSLPLLRPMQSAASSKSSPGSNPVRASGSRSGTAGSPGRSASEGAPALTRWSRGCDHRCRQAGIGREAPGSRVPATPASRAVERKEVDIDEPSHQGVNDSERRSRSRSTSESMSPGRPGGNRPNGPASSPPGAVSEGMLASSDTKRAVAPSSPTKKIWAASDASHVSQPARACWLSGRTVRPTITPKAAAPSHATATAACDMPSAAKITPGRYRIVAIPAIQQIARFVKSRAQCRPPRALRIARGAAQHRVCRRPRTRPRSKAPAQERSGDARSCRPSCTNQRNSPSRRTISTPPVAPAANEPDDELTSAAALPRPPCSAESTTPSPPR